MKTQPEYTETKIPPTACFSLSVSYVPDDGPIIVKHYGKAGNLLSESQFSPDEAYDYAQSVLAAYDAAVGV